MHAWMLVNLYTDTYSHCRHSDSSHTLTTTEACVHTHSTRKSMASVYLVTDLNWSCYSCPMGPPPVSSLPSSSSPPSSTSVFQTLLPHLLSSTLVLCASILAELSRPFFLRLSAGDPEFSSNMTSQRGLPLFSPSRLSLSSLSSSPLSVLLRARLCSPPHQVRGTEGWDLQQGVLLSGGFDQTESQERSLTDC